MGYFNGNKVLSFVKTMPMYKHTIHLTGIDDNNVSVSFDIDVPSTNNKNWTDPNLPYGNWDAVETLYNGFSGLLVGGLNMTNYMYMIVDSDANAKFYETLSDVPNNPTKIITDIGGFNIDTDFITPINIYNML